MEGLGTRRLTDADWPAVLEVAAAAFGEEYTDGDAQAFYLSFPFERSVGAFDNARLVGTVGVLPFQLTVPGGVSVPMGGVTWVAVLPTHRRRGILRRLMLELFADMHAHGEIAAGLLASEGNIYERFGFGPATSAVSIHLERPYAALIPSPDTETGSISLLDATEAASLLPAVYERLRLRQPGATDRPRPWWDSYLADPTHHREGMSRLYHAVHKDGAGAVDGYVSYRVKEDWTANHARNRVGVVELLAADLSSYRVLWDYILQTDLMRTVDCWRGRVDEPLRWMLTDLQRFEVQALHEGLWLRLLDAPRALGARAYAQAGGLVLEVIDGFPTPSRERFRLNVSVAGVAGAHCEPTTAAPDVVLGMEELGALYLGGVAFTTLASAGRIAEMTEGAIARADAMFRTATAPFCNTEF